MNATTELQKCIASRARSKFNLLYGIPIGMALILSVFSLSYWLPIPPWLIIVIAGIEGLVFVVDGINILVLNDRIRKLQNDT